MRTGNSAMTWNPTEMAAVAVRDKHLLLAVCIRRSHRGEFFLLHPHDQRKGAQATWGERWDPHASYHADGCFHIKAFDKELLEYQRQKLDHSFTGAVMLETNPLCASQIRSLNVPCRPERFGAGIFEIPI